MTRHGVAKVATSASVYEGEEALDCESCVEESKTARKPAEASRRERLERRGLNQTHAQDPRLLPAGGHGLPRHDAAREARPGLWGRECLHGRERDPGWARLPQ